MKMKARCRCYVLCITLLRFTREHKKSLSPTSDSVFGSDTLRVKCPADSRVWALDTVQSGDRDRPGPAESSLGATTLAEMDPCVTLHLLKEGLWFGRLSEQQEERWHWTLDSLTTALPAPDPGLHSVGYYPDRLLPCRQAMRHIKSPEKAVYVDGRERSALIWLYNCFGM